MSTMKVDCLTLHKKSSTKVTLGTAALTITSSLDRQAFINYFQGFH